MIFEAAISNHNGELVIKPRLSLARVLLDFLPGLFLVGTGCLVICVLLSAAGPKPEGSIGKELLGWIAIAAFVCALGIVPLVWGLRILFERRIYRISDKEAVLLSLLNFAGMPISTRRYLFSVFDRVSIKPKEFGVFGKHIEFVVSCDGGQRLDLCVFADHTTATTFAASIAAQMRLPVQDLVKKNAP